MGYNGRVVSRVGASLVVLGVLSIVFGTAGDAAFPWSGYHLISAPIWSGVMVLITGCLGLTSGKQPTNKGAMGGFLSLAIISIITTFAQWAISAIGIGNGWYFCRWSYSPCVGIHVVNLILGLVEFGLCFTSSILCCIGLCTAPSQTPGTMVMHHQHPGTVVPGQVAYYTTTGQVVIQGGQAYPVLMTLPGQAPPATQYVTTAGTSQPFPAATAAGAVVQPPPELGAQAPTTQVAQGPAPPPYSEKALQ